MRGNRRYVMSRSPRTSATPPVVSDSDSLPSVDSSFLRKLIHSGDSDFIDNLLEHERRQEELQQQERDKVNSQGKIIPRLTSSISKLRTVATRLTNKSSSTTRRQPQQTSATPNRFVYIFIGMVLMYVVLNIREMQTTRGWWGTYQRYLVDSMLETNRPQLLRGPIEKITISQTEAGGGGAQQQQQPQMSWSSSSTLFEKSNAVNNQKSIPSSGTTIDYKQAVYANVGDSTAKSAGAAPLFASSAAATTPGSGTTMIPAQIGSGASAPLFANTNQQRNLIPAT